MLEKGKKRTRRKAATGEAVGQSMTPAATRRESREAARPGPISAEERRRMIAEAAYFRAQRRGFRGGDPDRDWSEAEAEIDAMLLDRK